MYQHSNRKTTTPNTKQLRKNIHTKPKHRTTIRPHNKTNNTTKTKHRNTNRRNQHTTRNNTNTTGETMNIEINHQRLINIIELLKDSHKLTLTIDKDLIYENSEFPFPKHIEKNTKHLKQLQHNADVNVEITELEKEVQITVELKEYDL